MVVMVVKIVISQRRYDLIHGWYQTTSTRIRHDGTERRSTFLLYYYCYYSYEEIRFHRRSVIVVVIVVVIVDIVFVFVFVFVMT